MNSIPSDLLQRLRETLSRCGTFESDRALRARFVEQRIAPWCADYGLTWRLYSE